MTEYGYIRVSTVEQNEDRQRIAMDSAGIAEKNIFMDKQSGKDFERPAYRRLMKKLKPGDVVFFKSIDRMGRNYADILAQWRIITKEKGADVVVLDMPLLDTRRDKDLIGTLISDIVLQLFSYVAETERTNIRQRQAEGIAAAKKRGVRFGRPLKVPSIAFEDILKMWERKEVTMGEIQKQYGLSQSTFYRRKRLAESSKEIDP